ncbi:MAG: efflux RND transporter periplasmic adaptor subunit [Deltaproteobacteria bacterium]|jgi:RND family efflux transporter MFP subunit|nr:efflux RND transporter periplasmic adaptor subunit [Deltaproteobacteria bacterium]MBT4527168.1 efflux RND transporter periplasmic adaptor subunit [Deltaproteobacteria bacterium]
MIIEKITRFLIVSIAIFNINFITNPVLMAQEKMNVINIETLELIPRTMKISKSYLGHLEPNDRVILKTEIDGTIEKIDFEQGKSVKKGQVLFHISTQELNLNVIAAKSRFNQALSEYNTQKQLFFTIQPNQLSDSIQVHKKGQVFSHVSTQELKLNVIAAKSRYKQALSEYNTQKQLYFTIQSNHLSANLLIPEKDNISENELQSVEVENQIAIKQLELQVDIAQSGHDQASLDYQLQKKLFLKQQFSKASMMKTSDLAGYNNQILLQDSEALNQKKFIHILTRQQEAQARISATNYKQALSDYNKQKTMFEKNISNVSTLEKYSNQLEITLQKLQLDRLNLEKSIIQDKTRLKTYENSLKVAKAKLDLTKMDLAKAKFSDLASIEARTAQLKQLRLFQQQRDQNKTSVNTYIDTKSLELQLNIAENNYAHALADYRTQKKLFKENMSNAATFEGYYNALKMNQFKLQLAHLNYEQSKIRDLNRLDNVRDSMEIAKAQYEIAQLKMEKSQILDLSRLDNVKDSMEIAKAQYEIAQLKMEKSKIKAPFNAIAKDKIGHLGEFIQKGGHLVELMDISKVKASVNIPETEVQYIRTGKVALVKLDAFPGKKYTGVIQTLGLEADLKSRSFPLEVIISNKKRKLYPGMMARVELITRTKKNQIIVPRFAVLDRERGSVVFIENDGEVLLKPVTVGQMIKDEVQILSGIKLGDKLVVVGQNLLADKEKVNVVKFNKQVK